jgi:hypothetical protein
VRCPNHGVEILLLLLFLLGVLLFSLWLFAISLIVGLVVRLLGLGGRGSPTSHGLVVGGPICAVLHGALE